jgi:murein L,D-transpeptidase YcbB/YkuD
MHPRRSVFALLTILLAASAVTACREEPPQTTPELQAILGSSGIAGVANSTWAQVQRFYSERQQTAAWTTDEPTDRAAQALDVLRSADTHGLSAADYREPELRQTQTQLLQSEEEGPARARQLAEFDVRLTASLLQLAQHVAMGRLTPESVDSLWKHQRKAPDLAAALQRAVNENVTGFLDQVRPPHPEYKALQDALASLRGQSAKGWAPVPRATLKVGQWNQAVVALRQRLAVGGYLPQQAAADSPQYDAEVEAAVKAFQTAHGLKPSGQLDPPTVAALNVPLDKRIQQVAMNLERWRWMPDDLGARHFLVNVPYFHLIAREQGEPVLDIRVVVGKRGNETPIFSDEMETVVFSPYWNVPESIAVEETVPALARDPNYLSRNNMEVVSSSGRVVDPSAVPWGNPDALRAYSFRQRPGSNNALGFVKFLFPNEHSVYLHDTPADALFKRIGRAFSHGCVRVEEPEVLAQYILRDQPEWTPERIVSAMRAGTERHVKLAEKIPVHIVYFTAWVDDNGGLHFQDDVYGYDAKQAQAEPGARQRMTGAKRS